MLYILGILCGSLRFMASPNKIFALGRIWYLQSLLVSLDTSNGFFEREVQKQTL